MPKKFRVFFFVWVLVVMGAFALVGITYAEMNAGMALFFFVLAILFTGVGFMIRKRVLRSMGMIKDQTNE